MRFLTMFPGTLTGFTQPSPITFGVLLLRDGIGMIRRYLNKLKRLARLLAIAIQMRAMPGSRFQVILLITAQTENGTLMELSFARITFKTPPQQCSKLVL